MPRASSDRYDDDRMTAGGNDDTYVHHAVINMVLQSRHRIERGLKFNCWCLVFLAVSAAASSGGTSTSSRFRHSWRGHIFTSPVVMGRTSQQQQDQVYKGDSPFRKNPEIKNGDEEKTGSRRAAKHEMNQMLHRASRPRVMAGTAATAGLLHFLHSNREATRRAIYFWTRAGPMVIHYRFTQFWLESVSRESTKARPRI